MPYAIRSRSAARPRAKRRHARTASIAAATIHAERSATSAVTGAAESIPQTARSISAAGPSSNGHVTARTTRAINARKGTTAITVNGTASRLDAICSRATRPQASPASKNAEQRALVNFARMSLFEPEVVFCERPLADITPATRGLVTTWMGQVVDAGGILITAGEPLREALLMPGTAYYEEDGRFFEAKTAVGDDPDDVGTEYAGDEVRVFKVPARANGATLLFDPREVDFIESVNRANFASVRGELYPVTMTLDELEAELERFGFFRCHRSYIVNVQKVTKVERFTRNSFNLTLADARMTQIPLAKGRADAMRDRYGWR